MLLPITEMEPTSVTVTSISHLPQTLSVLGCHRHSPSPPLHVLFGSCSKPESLTFEGQRNVDEDNFIDDSGVEPAYYGDEEPRSPGDVPQAEEGEEDDRIKNLFKIGEKKKKNERSPAEIKVFTTVTELPII